MLNYHYALDFLEHKLFFVAVYLCLFISFAKSFTKLYFAIFYLHMPIENVWAL